MRPRLSRLDASHVGSAYPEINGDFAVHPNISPYRPNGAFCQPRTAMPFTSSGNFSHDRAMLVAWNSTAPFDAVAGVFGISSPSEVSRINALRDIARVQRQRPSRARAPRQLQCNMGRQNRKRAPIETIRDAAIAASITAAGPQPATRANRKFSTKSVLERRVKNGHRVVSHVERSMFIRGQGRALLKQRFRPVLYGRFTVRSQRKAP